MTKEEILLAAHDHLVDHNLLDKKVLTYEFEPQELIDLVQRLLAAERERCAVICERIGVEWKGDYQAIRAMAAEDLADIIRRVK